MTRCACPKDGSFYCDWCMVIAARAGLSLPPGQPVRQALTLAPETSERQFQGALQTIAKQLGYLYYHTHTSIRSTAGWPDVALVHPDGGGPLYVWELKRAGAQPSPAQRRWLHALAQASHIEVGTYWPADLAAMTTLLQRRNP